MYHTTIRFCYGQYIHIIYTYNIYIQRKREHTFAICRQVEPFSIKNQKPRSNPDQSFNLSFNHIYSTRLIRLGWSGWTGLDQCSRTLFYIFTTICFFLKQYAFYYGSYYFCFIQFRVKCILFTRILGITLLGDTQIFKIIVC